MKNFEKLKNHYLGFFPNEYVLQFFHGTAVHVFILDYFGVV